MKIKSLLLFFLILNCTITFSQNLPALDNKKGYMDIKIGQPISSLSNKVKQDKELSNVYFIINTSEYYVENHVIDKIIIMVSEDGKKTIEHFTLMFVNRIDELIRTVKNSSASLEVRQNALKEAQELEEKGPEYNFYNRLFKDAFGEPTRTPEGIEKWKGKTVSLFCTKSSDVSLINFAKVNSEEYIKNKRIETGKKATSKF